MVGPYFKKLFLIPTYTNLLDTCLCELMYLELQARYAYFKILKYYF